MALIDVENFSQYSTSALRYCLLKVQAALTDPVNVPHKVVFVPEGFLSDDFSVSAVAVGASTVSACRSSKQWTAKGIGRNARL